MPGARLTSYTPPGYLTDYDHIPGQLSQWSDAVSGWFDECIAFEEQNALSQGDKCQYYNQLNTNVPEPVLEQAIVWNALPGTFRQRYGRRQALELADHLLPLSQRMDGPGPYFVGGQWEAVY